MIEHLHHPDIQDCYPFSPISEAAPGGLNQ